MALALTSLSGVPVASAIAGFLPSSRKLQLFRSSSKALAFTQVGTAVSKDRWLLQRVATSSTLRWQEEPNVVKGAHVTRTLATASRSPVEAAETVVEEAPSAEDVEDQQYELAKIWRQIQGEDDWKSISEYPTDPILCRELLRYGEFSQICYDSYESNTQSIYCGSNKYHKSLLLEKMGKGKCGYEVTDYLYATASVEVPSILRVSKQEHEARWSGDSNWMGYVAVTTDEKEIKRLGRRDIVVAWRGTIAGTEWIEDLRMRQTSPGWEKQYPKVKVEEGFLDIYTSSKSWSRFNKQSVREQLQDEVRRLLKKYEGEEISITITGHSLGAALALLSAYDIATTFGDGDEKPSMITVFSFAGPRVGNWAFKERVEDLGIKVLRIVNVDDVVPKVPGYLWNDATWARCWAYYHVGTKLTVDTAYSPFLRTDEISRGDYHNLEGHLHMVDGYRGPSLPFASLTKRHPSLVNKSSNFLHVDAFIPGSWWQDLNKGLVRNERGDWVVPQRDEKDFPKNQNDSQFA